ncbi:lipoprotein Spr/probable lipoprotein NlpC [Pontibacter aydingkolensis]|uniref:C40 family peptidase n=1 Tax=Pontibacter aydingkolensis TaxID=1911536 RepID=A0ABS7CQJ0_9BACT|nr:NlpC/P60 family protein [Pontibacter aydingkolensis]MBW7465976.1 C40 family peptidase [Pontibacter aydingkolensis]
MTKTIVLTALAIISVVLSYFYEVTPAKSATPESTAAAFHITPYAINSGEDMVRALELYEPIEEAKAEEFFSKRLNMAFANPDAKDLVETVAKWIGTPYRYGSNSKKGTDCSGFVTSIYREVYGVKLRRSSHSMFQEVQRIQKDSIRTGDLVFFRRSSKQPVFHVGIYLKNNKFIHSATNGGVMVSSLKEPYYRNYYYAAGRVN